MTLKQKANGGALLKPGLAVLGLVIAMMSLGSHEATAVSKSRAPSPILSEIRYSRKGLSHEYSIVRERAVKTKSGLPTKPGYALIFKENGRVPLKKTLKANEAEFYSNAMNRILWANEYGSRKPASTAKCREYVRIQVVGDKTRICQENKKLTGQSYGLLNELRSQFAN